MNSSSKKKCTKCGEEKELKDFHKSQQGRNGVHSWCKSCASDFRKNHEVKIKTTDPDRYKKIEARRRSNSYFRKYGITIDEYNKLFAKQQGLCAICGLPERRTNGRNAKVMMLLAVDHNHSSNKVRGLLCRDCNTAIGFFKDDISLLKKAITYLRKG